MKNLDWKDIWKRAGKTFIQAFVVTAGATQLPQITNLETAKAALFTVIVAGGSAGVSAVWNMLTDYLSNKEWR